MAAALGSSGRKGSRAEYRCGSCPGGSDVAADAIPLGLAGKEGAKIMQALGVSDTEAWCPHCRKFALWILRRVAK